MITKVATELSHLNNNKFHSETAQVLELWRLEFHLANDSKAPDSVIIDGQYHDYEKVVSGRLRQGRYRGTYYTKKKNSKRSFLIFNYGLYDDPEQMSYSSLDK